MDNLSLALEDLKAAVEAGHRRTLKLERYPEIVEFLEEWVSLYKDDKRVSYKDVAAISSRRFGQAITYNHVRDWVDRYHPEMVGGRSR